MVPFWLHMTSGLPGPPETLQALLVLVYSTSTTYELRFMHHTTHHPIGTLHRREQNMRNLA